MVSMISIRYVVSQVQQPNATKFVLTMYKHNLNVLYLYSYLPPGNTANVEKRHESIKKTKIKPRNKEK